MSRTQLRALLPQGGILKSLCQLDSLLGFRLPSLLRHVRDRRDHHGRHVHRDHRVHHVHGRRRGHHLQ